MLVTAALFGAIFIWNEFLVALYVINSRDHQTSRWPPPLVSRQRPIDWNIAAAVGVVTVIPILLFSLLVQRYIVRGITAGAVRVAVATVSFTAVGKVYRDGTRALDDFALDVDDGEFMVFVGPSGCRARRPPCAWWPGSRRSARARSGSASRVVNGVHPSDRDVAMVFQNYALYPHMTVYDEHRVRAEAAEAAARGDRAGGSARPPRILGLTDVAEAQARAALGRPAAARGHGPGDRPGAAGLPDGRAAVQPRRRSSASRCAPRSLASSTSWARRRSTSPTTRSRR